MITKNKLLSNEKNSKNITLESIEQNPYAQMV